MQDRPLHSFAALILIALAATCGCSDEKPSTSAIVDGAKAVPESEKTKQQTATAGDASEFAPLKTTPRPSAKAELQQSTSPTTSILGSARVRTADDRPELNARRLEQAGIFRYESQRLILLSDLPAAKVRHLAGYADQLFEHLQKHFGELPPAVDESEFQVTGCLISDKQKFQSVGLMPEASFTFDHGGHRNYQFWMYSQPEDYYQRHLMLHEFTHCFMTCECGVQNAPPSWYLEGMAEFFSTHRIDGEADQRPQTEFGILPNLFKGFEGWGRISELRRSFKRKQTPPNNQLQSLAIPSLHEVMPDSAVKFQDWGQYASSWALCWMLQTHPEYLTQFQSLDRIRTRHEFIATAKRLREQHQPRINVDWLLFMETLEQGFQPEHCWPVHTEAGSLSKARQPATRAETMQLLSHRDWQAAGVELAAGESITLSCKGRFIVNDQPRPWWSEPQGVSIEYYRNHPLGQVVAAFVGNDGRYISERISIGTDATITAPCDCSLWLQINDSSAARHNNSGLATITFQQP